MTGSERRLCHMREVVTKKYLEMVPDELREMTMALSDDKHWALYIALLKNEEMTFTEIKTEFGEHPQTLSNILKDLSRGGLVIKKAKSLDEITDRSKSYYVATEVGELFIECLMNNMVSGKRSKKAGISSSNSMEKYCGREYGNDFSISSDSGTINVSNYSQA